MASFNADTRPIIGRGPSLVARLLFLGAISMALMVTDHHYAYLAQVRSALSTAVYPLRWLVDAPFRAGRWLSDSVADRNQLRSENELLNTQLRDAEVQLQTLASLQAEVRRLRAMNEAADDFSRQRLVAQIMRVDLDPLRHRVLLNKGAKQGVFKGQPVLDAQGIVGQITQVNRNTAEAILISDAEHALPVRVNRSGLRTIAEGTGQLNRLNLPYLTGDADVKVGDLLVASGLGGVYPAGYPVGIVTKVERDAAETFATVEAKPLAKLDSDYEVVLLWYQAPVIDTTPVAPTTATASASANAHSSAGSATSANSTAATGAAP